MSYKKTEQYDEQTTAFLMSRYKDILGKLGEDPNREGLDKTPERVAKAMQFMMQGYELDAHAILDSAKFHEPMSEMIIVKDIEIYSLCEHHMLPFFGKAHVAYIPNGWITGLEQNSAGSGCFCAPAPGAGKTDYADFTCYPGFAAAPGCRCRDRSFPFMHDDARGTKTKFSYYNLSVLWRIPKK